MLMTEFNMDDALAVRFAEGIEKGREEVFQLFSQGLSMDEIKQRLGNKAI